MDTSNVRFRPEPVTAQAEMTSTYGHPRPNLPVMGRMNTFISVTIIGVTLISVRLISEWDTDGTYLSG